MSFKTVLSSEVNIGTIHVNLQAGSSGQSTHKSSERFDLQFSGVPRVVACLRNIDESLSSANKVGITSNISNVTVDGFDYDCTVNGSGNLVIDYTAVYHVDRNPLSKLYNRKIAIKSVPYQSYISNNNGIIELNEELRKFEYWIIEPAGTNIMDYEIYLYSEAFNKYLVHTPNSTQLTHGKKSNDAIWKLSGGNTKGEKFTFYSDTFLQNYLCASKDGNVENSPYAHGLQDALFEIEIV